MTYTILLAACAGKPRPAGLPCGVAQASELRPHGDPKCEPDGSCYPGPVLSKVGTCTVGPSRSFDRFEGRSRSTIFEDGDPILSSDAPPSARIVVFDPRVPTPDGIRVGMTRADLERMFPGKELVCRDDVAWRGQRLCGVRRNTECGAEDANWRLVILDRAQRIVAVDLGPGCGED